MEDYGYWVIVQDETFGDPIHRASVSICIDDFVKDSWDAVEPFFTDSNYKVLFKINGVNVKAFFLGAKQRGGIWDSTRDQIRKLYLDDLQKPGRKSIYDKYY